jgi:predicted Ser/Thr protein kinase
VSLLRDGVTNDRVVVKTIPLQTKAQKARTAAVKEAKVLEMMEHLNAIGYLTSYLDDDRNLDVVLESADGRDLQKCLESHTEVNEA